LIAISPSIRVSHGKDERVFPVIQRIKKKGSNSKYGI